jgi:hypothetical protein
LERPACRASAIIAIAGCRTDWRIAWAMGALRWKMTMPVMQATILNVVVWLWVRYAAQRNDSTSQQISDWHECSQIPQRSTPSAG